MAIRTLKQILGNQALGLVAGVSLLALAGCSAPTAPTAHGSDYYAEASSPPPLMGEAPGSVSHGNGLMGGPPVDVNQGGPLPAATTRHEGVVTFRRADGVLVTTMRPIANPEDMTRAERLRVYGERPARTAQAAPRRVYSSDARVAPAPVRAAAPVRAPAPVAAAPIAPSRPAPVAAAPAAPAPVAKAPPAPTMKPGTAPSAPPPAAPVAAAPADSADAPKGGGLFSFLAPLKFWDREVKAPDAEATAQKAGDLAGEAAEAANTAAADAGAAVENQGVSTRTILLALAVLAGVLILAAISRNAAAKRREAQRRRRFQTFGYGSGASAFGSEPEPAQSSGFAAPLAAAAAGAVAATAFADHQADKADAAEAPKPEHEPA